MNKILIVILASYITIQTGLSQEKGKVYFMRSTGFSAYTPSGYSAFIDDELACKLNNKRFSIHEVDPGEHEFSVQFSGKRSRDNAERIDIKIEEGKTYYIQMIHQIGFFRTKL